MDEPPSSISILPPPYNTRNCWIDVFCLQGFKTTLLKASLATCGAPLEKAYSSYQEQITQLEGAKKSVDIRHGQKLGGPGVLNH